MKALVIFKLLRQSSDWKNSFMIFIRPYLALMPYLLFAVYFGRRAVDVSFVFSSVLVAICVGDYVVALNYEFYSDIISNRIADIYLSRTSLEAYFLANSFFYLAVYFLLAVIMTILYSFFFRVELIVSTQSFLLAIITLILLYMNAYLLALLLSLVTIKTKRFFLSSLISNLVLIFSGMFFCPGGVSSSLRWIVLSSPFCHLFELARTLFDPAYQSYLNVWWHVVWAASTTAFFWGIYRLILRKTFMKKLAEYL